MASAWSGGEGRPGGEWGSGPGDVRFGKDPQTEQLCLPRAGSRGAGFGCVKLKVRGGDEACEADGNSESVSSEGIRAGPGPGSGVRFSSVSLGARAGA